jgi:aspartate/methionine/tyrosine aminotransferase
LVIQYPTYPPALEIAVNRNERQVSLWEGKIQNGHWCWDLAELDALCQKNTRAVFLCHPHNPTGSVMTESEYQALITFASERELLLICDEVYRFLEYDSAIRKKPIVECYEKGISIGSLSKAFALPGLRTGWIAINDEEMRDKLISYKSRTTLCNSVVTQFLAEKALAKKDGIIASVQFLVNENLRSLESFIAGHSKYFDWVAPQAGTVAFLALKDRQNAETFCYDLAKKAGVLCLPGAMFSYEPHYLRIGFGREHFPKALDLMGQYLEA